MDVQERGQVHLKQGSEYTFRNKGAERALKQNRGRSALSETRGRARFMRVGAYRGSSDSPYNPRTGRLYLCWYAASSACRTSRNGVRFTYSPERGQGSGSGPDPVVVVTDSHVGQHAKHDADLPWHFGDGLDTACFALCHSLIPCGWVPSGGAAPCGASRCGGLMSRRAGNRRSWTLDFIIATTH